MRNIGLRILRFSDREVFENIEGVIKEDMGEDMIWKISPNPSFSKRGVIHRKARRTEIWFFLKKKFPSAVAHSESNSSRAHRDAEAANYHWRGSVPKQ